MEEIVLCNRPHKCCPKFGDYKVGKTKKYYVSDAGEIVTFTKKQLTILYSAIQKELGL